MYKHVVLTTLVYERRDYGDREPVSVKFKEVTIEQNKMKCFGGFMCLRKGSRK